MLGCVLVRFAGVLARTCVCRCGGMISSGLQPLLKFHFASLLGNPGVHTVDTDMLLALLGSNRTLEA